MQRQYGHAGASAGDPSRYGCFPHHGSFGNQDGFLTVTDALMRSCNVVFETIADRMGLEEVQAAMANFGLGRLTGIGIEESKGHIPNPAHIPPALRRMTCCMAGIGEEQVSWPRLCKWPTSPPRWRATACGFARTCWSGKR